MIFHSFVVRFSGFRFQCILIVRRGLPNGYFSELQKSDFMTQSNTKEILFWNAKALFYHSARHSEIQKLRFYELALSNTQVKIRGQDLRSRFEVKIWGQDVRSRFEVKIWGQDLVLMVVVVVFGEAKWSGATNEMDRWTLQRFVEAFVSRREGGKEVCALGWRDHHPEERSSLNCIPAVLSLNRTRKTNLLKVC